MSSPRSIPTADIISSLPDLVLSHILSFLPTKLAVTTSVLSKRWTPLWLSVPTLDVDQNSFPNSTSFRHFVYSVFVFRDATLPLQSFRIRCGQSDNFDLQDLNHVVLIAVKQGLENFDLTISMIFDSKILDPTILRVLSCKTLVVLKLNDLTICDLPHSVDLPLLKTLHLVSIYFPKLVGLMNLFNGCPILEDLHTGAVDLYYNWSEHDWHDSKQEFKGFPKLVRANLYDCWLNFPFAWLYNAKFMCVELQEMAIDEFQLPTFHNLTHVELIFNCEWHEHWVLRMLHHCPKLQNLIVVQDDKYDEVVEDGYWKEPKIVPECLSSQLRICSLRGYRGSQSSLQFVEYIMLNSKLLYTMTIESNWVDEKEKHQMLKKLSSYPRGSVTCKLLFD